MRISDWSSDVCSSDLLVPESWNGTNPATAAFAGYRVENIPANTAGRVDLDALKARLGPDVAAVMITNPNTCGLFERDMMAISDAVHAEIGRESCRERVYQYAQISLVAVPLKNKNKIKITK